MSSDARTLSDDTDKGQPPGLGSPKPPVICLLPYLGSSAQKKAEVCRPRAQAQHSCRAQDVRMLPSLVGGPILTALKHWAQPEDSRGKEGLRDLIALMRTWLFTEAR